ncbi:hypothetical protein SO802_017103 [Lithocarpus litseifolius]|uniref:Uncharacterized protein n=1 Tax=Lithocarpus litseifolius TaxID=425828 RepID=A0AAW2CYB9_9ROSI
MEDAMKENPKNQLWLQNKSNREDLDYIPVFDSTVDDHAYDLLINGIEQCYWYRVLGRVFYNSDEDVDEDVDEEMDYEDDDDDEYDKLHDPHFF